MRIGLITNEVAPYYCGIGDHSLHLAKALRTTGHDVIILAGRGSSSKDVYIVDCNWDYQGLEALYRKVESLDLDHLILQFTPLMYASEKNHKGNDLVHFWDKCARRWKTSIIVHETYFRVWWYPKSWVNGMKERRLLKNMVLSSHFVFSASQPLVDEMKMWGNDVNVQLLPIGSNFPVINANREVFRSRIGVMPDDVVLLLFGGGNSLKWMKRHVYAVDSLLHCAGVKAHWLMLGGIPETWFTLKYPVISPGRLSEEQVSFYLQSSDIFLMPHYVGLSAKRGTLMAVMQHALPVVGIRTEMTEGFWNDIEGVRLSPRYARNEFAQQALALSLESKLRLSLGRKNQEYFQSHFTWPIIVHDLLKTIDN